MKIYAILVSFIVIGLGLSLLHTACPEGHWAATWLMHLAAVLVIGGGLGIIDKALLHRDHFRQTRELFMIHESTVQLGLEEIARDANHYSYASLIRESPSLSMVLNDGRTWISSKISDFAVRFTNHDFLTELFVPDPEGEFVTIIARKTGYDRDEQVAKIEQAKKRLIEEFTSKGKKGRLVIYHMPHFPTHSVFLGSDRAAVSMYGVSSGRRAVPLFAFRKLSCPDCLFADVRDDVEKLRAESVSVFDSAQDFTKEKPKVNQG